MKFKINDRTWEIKELTQEEIKQHMKDYKFDGEPEEEVVNIVSNSHFIIHDIITKFYQERGGKENATNKD